MISRVQCFIGSTALFFGALSAFANSTAFNGYVQSNGSAGIDLSSIDGGNYRVTVTRGGQLNFRYMIGGQAFDSNPEAAVLDTVSNNNDSWNNTWTPSAYVSAAANQDPGIGVTVSNDFNPGFVLFSPATQEAAALSSSDDLEGVHAQTASSPYSEGLSGTNFYVPKAQAPESYQIPGTSMIALVNSSTSNLFYANSDDWWVGVQQEVPEPATFALIAGVLFVFVTRASWPALIRASKARLLR